MASAGVGPSSDSEQRFSCSSTGFPRDNEVIKLYLSSGSLKIHCFFQTENELASKGMLSVFTSGGLAPSLAIMNSTYNGIFHFNLSLFSDQIYWAIEIPRENITQNTDIAAVEEWLVRITLHHGLNIYATEGTLLDRVREPILQWPLGTVIPNRDVSQLYPHTVDLKVTKCPCANDVALLGFVLNTTFEGVYIGLTFSGFWNYIDTTWYNMTDIIYNHLQEEYSYLSLVDIVLTNHFLVILTSLGLFVTEDLRYPSAQPLTLSRADFCGFERVDYIKGKLWYNERCFANREHFEVDYVTVTFDRNKTLSEANSCFYGKEPFHEWKPCLPYVIREGKNTPSSVVTFLIDQEHSTGIYLSYNQIQRIAMASVNILKNNKPNIQPKFPPFQFPSSFSSPVGMVFHPRSHFLYAYGNQIWLSVDGGNTFELLADFHDDIIERTFHSFYSSDITFVAKSGKVYLTKAGLGRYTITGSVTDDVFTLYYDQLGFVHKLTPDNFEGGGSPTASENSRNIFGQPPDMSFGTALAPQYISLHEMIFFAYVPEGEPQDTLHTKKFNNMHKGKVIHSKKTGKAYINEVLQHDTPKGFLTSVIAEMIQPFGIEEVTESSCLSSSLSITYTGNSVYKLTLDSQVADALFEDTDIEKTVVIPDHSSFLITAILDNKNASAIATMPERAPVNHTFQKNTWFLYNFGQRNGPTWTVYSKPCNFWFQQDDSLALNIVKYIDLGNSQTLKVKVIPNSESLRTPEVPLLKVLTGNPTLLEVKAEGTFDDTNSYLIKISAASKILRQGSTSLAFIVWGASSDCFVTTMVPTLKSSCSYLKSMHHIPSHFIPLEDWNRGVHQDSQGFNLIKTLPINYRPPSNMGIAIPLTDNFYHADPSQPIPRNLFYKSKEAGKFKQCANASNREECNCTNYQKFSYAVAFSDCREKVPRFKFPVLQYPISLEIYNEDGRVPVKPPYLVTMTEVNMRKNWNLKHSVPENVQKMKNYLESVLQAPVYNPSGLNLSIKGSELFHFRVTVIPGVTFCNLVEEFQIYVDEAPLPFPGHTLIAVATAVVLGGLIFTSFMLQLRDIHPWRALQNWINRKKATLSNISFSEMVMRQKF
ncbi:cation channel sperm-associated auxiliary subunit beta [Nycticebus coucang]|uniref:cation channel sperm-associated auxiliary subunit beta n=1 Tax=Nycticebus coucang TaxID=9470 RepID=UPI00234D108F|nr:cation channel sperm-associated auxiliary subunit beta [Nycticebus coucang]